MAIKKNLVSDREEHTRYLGNFRGVDFSSDPSEVHDSRFAECVNMYKDYRSGQGQAIETIPGFREIVSGLEGEIYGIHVYEKDGEKIILVHAGEKLYEINDDGYSSIDNLYVFFSYFNFTLDENGEIIETKTGTKAEKGELLIMKASKSTSFLFNNRLYILDGKNYIYFSVNTKTEGDKKTTEKRLCNVLDEAYVPTTHISLNPDGAMHESTENTGEYLQQNILSEKYTATFVCDGEAKSFYLPMGCDSGENSTDTDIKEDTFYYLKDGDQYTKVKAVNNTYLPKSFKVMLYGVEIPYATTEGDVPYAYTPYAQIKDENGSLVYYNEKVGEFRSKISMSQTLKAWSEVEQKHLTVYPCVDPEKCCKYPVAIKSLSKNGVITFTDAPSRPQDNGFSYAGGNEGEVSILRSEVVKGQYAYPEGYAGLEVTAKKAVRTIKGITATDSNVGSIITECNIATVHDGRVFLSGNPRYPNFVFYNGINPETGYSDPSYFGVLNWFSEGVGSAPITGLMPISNALMVLRRDTVQDGSVTFRYRHETGEDVMPVTYTADEGLPGVGCLGACCNFLDDPIFISKYGVEAMGQLSTRLERAIEHRSSLIDGLLLNLDLSKASITEYGGYLVLLIEGKIFLADSRQRYTHESGVMQYEWFYLDDIGIYEGQYDGFKYAELPHADMEGKLIVDGTTITQAPEEMIGEFTEREFVGHGGMSSTNESIIVNKNGVDYTYYYRLTRIVDRQNRRKTTRYYIEPTGAMTGGTFDPAVIIKAIGDDLYFGTRGGRIGKFYFDKRDPLDDYKIPTEYYTFNGRTIRSCCVTKMDNCGVPHLNKSTVKKSMVVKMRTFPKSAVKIKVRTNRRNVRDVERLYGGRFDPDELDFFDLSYETGEKNIFRVREKEKKWVEKQLYFVSDEYCRPFSLHYVAYGYNIAGRYKD